MPDLLLERIQAGPSTHGPLSAPPHAASGRQARHGEYRLGSVSRDCEAQGIELHPARLAPRQRRREGRHSSFCGGFFSCGAPQIGTQIVRGNACHAASPPVIMSGRSFSIGMPVAAATLKMRSAGTCVSAHCDTAPGVTPHSFANATPLPRPSLRYLRSSLMPCF